MTVRAVRGTPFSYAAFGPAPVASRKALQGLLGLQAQRAEQPVFCVDSTGLMGALTFPEYASSLRQVSALFTLHDLKLGFAALELVEPPSAWAESHVQLVSDLREIGVGTLRSY